MGDDRENDAAASLKVNPDTLSLSGKVAIVTGSGKEPGLGAGIVAALARNGAAVVINYMSDTTKPRAEALASRLQEELGAKAVAIQANVESKDGAECLVSKALRAFGCSNVHILGKNRQWIDEKLTSLTWSLTIVLGQLTTPVATYLAQP